MALTGSKRASERDGEHGDQSIAFEVTKPINPDALVADLGLGGYGVVIEGDHAKASPDSPVWLWIVPGDDEAPETNKIKGAISRNEGPTEDADLMALVAAANNDETLTPEQVESAVRCLLKRVGRTL